MAAQIRSISQHNRIPGAKTVPPYPRPRRLGDRKGVPANHPLDGLLSLFAHLFGALRAPLRGPAVHGPSPFVAARHFPHSVGESSRAPAESPLPAPVGALFVRHWRTAPFEKAGETFMFFPDRGVCDARHIRSAYSRTSL